MKTSIDTQYEGKMRDRKIARECISQKEDISALPSVSITPKCMTYRRKLEVMCFKVLTVKLYELI